MDKDFYSATFLHLFRWEYLSSKLKKIKTPTDITIKMASQLLKNAEKQQEKAAYQVKLTPENRTATDSLAEANARVTAAKTVLDVANMTLDREHHMDDVTNLDSASSSQFGNHLNIPGRQQTR